ncbi:MAG TPA: tRNA (adenosine(37)-N6)-dimethylallyltransferase MiaA [Thermoanaerobaculia bacterium]|nr:tRNA (adenosine(37)-N6)-dimethylallyltransferase MiaA [Thermoanaerobaculia bacterium]
MSAVLAIVGPTASGKSDLAMRLAEDLGGEIVNADALQVYRGFDVGTAKPTLAERTRVPHHLVDILDPHQPYSAGEFARRARQAIAEIRARHRLPIVVGGSGLYLRALLAGISSLPAVDPRLRRGLRSMHRRRGLVPLRRMLELLDPEVASRLAASDPQRTSRALEVALGTGRPLSWWIAREPFGDKGMEAAQVGLTLARPLLYDRIAGRVSRMLAMGWVGEVEALLAAGVDPSMPAFQAIGYRQLARHVMGEGSLEEAVADTVRATRRFAKRQQTWFRSEPDVTWFPADDVATQMPRILHFLAITGIGREHGQARD